MIVKEERRKEAMRRKEEKRMKFHSLGRNMSDGVNSPAEEVAVAATTADGNGKKSTTTAREASLGLKDINR